MIFKKSLIAMFIALFVASPINTTVFAQAVADNLSEPEETTEITETEETDEVDESDEISAEEVVEEVEETEVSENEDEVVSEKAEETTAEETTSTTDAAIETETTDEDTVTDTETASTTPLGFIETVVKDLIDPLFAEETTNSDSEDDTNNVTFIERVELGVEYTYHDNDQVKVVFTRLPENSGSLFIEKVILTDEQVEAFGALSNVAYDITSSMENGSFEYDLTLPAPKNSKGTSKVVYAENVEALTEGNATVVEDTKVTSGLFEDSVAVDDMNHFTIFVVVRTSEDFANLNWVPDRSAPTGGWTETATTLVMSIDASERSTASSFYYTEGVQADIPAGKNSVKVDLYIDPNWSSVDFVRAGLWGKVARVINPASNDVAWPIMEFTNADANPRIRVWDTIVGGWTDVAQPVAYGDTIDFEVLQNPYTDMFEFYLNGNLVDSYSSISGPDNYEFYDGLILNAYNNAISDYDVTWSNLEIGVVEIVPKPETTIVVQGDTSAGENQLGWLFNRDQGTKTPFEFNTDTASIGDGALYVLPIGGTNASDKFIGELFLLDEIANIDSISYDFEIGSGGSASDENEFYMNVYANFGESDETKFYDCRYNVVPTVGVVGDFTTVTFDPAQAYPVTTRGGASASPYTCPAVPADMDDLSPGSVIRVVAINLGDTSLNDAGVDGYFDNVVVETADEITIYDFEYINEKPEVSIESPSPLENSFVKGIITGRAVATDDHGMGSSYLRFWKDSFESGIANLVGNCQNAPGADLLGTSVDATCEYDSRTNPDGTYVFSAQFLDSDIKWGSALRTFTVDNTRPVVTLENPATTSTAVMSDESFEISATDNFELQRITGNIYQNGSLVKSNSKVVAGDSASFTFDITSLPEGDYSMKYNAQDAAGNISQTKVFTFAIDNTAPTVTIKDSSIGNAVDVFSNVSFKLFDAKNIDKVEINGVVKDLSNNKWSDVNGVRPGVFGAVEGENTMVVFDVAGNTTTIEFVLDTTAPTIPVITTPTAEQVFATTPIANQWTASTDELDVTYQIAYAYDDEHTFGGSTCTDVSEIDGKAVSGCRDTVNTSRNHTPALSEQGGVTIFVRAFDEIGNTSDWSEGVHYYYIVEVEEEEEETIDPFGAIISPIANATTSGLVSLVATYDDGDEDNDDIVQWAVRAGNCSVASENVFGNVGGFNDPYDWDGANFSAVIDTTGEISGEYCFIFNPKDDGDVDVRETVTFIIDNTVNEEEPVEEEPVIPVVTLTTVDTTSSRAGSSRRSSERSGSGGQVLGASIGLGTSAACDATTGMYLNSYMGMNGVTNIPGDVALLQVFLNAQGYEIPVTGEYDAATIDAVNQFQLVHLAEILTPWGITAPTGNVFKTTRWKINNMVCPGSEVYPSLISA